jgi:hypothetical protein
MLKALSERPKLSKLKSLLKLGYILRLALHEQQEVLRTILILVAIGHVQLF